MPEINLNIHQDAWNAYSDMNMKNAYQYIVFKLTPDYKEIVLDSTYARNEDQQASFDSLNTTMKALPASESRFIFFRVDWDKVEDNGLNGGKRSKVVIISAIGSLAPVKSKLMFAACKEPMKRKLNCVTSEVQGALNGLDLGEITEKAKQFTR